MMLTYVIGSVAAELPAADGPFVAFCAVLFVAFRTAARSSLAVSPSLAGLAIARPAYAGELCETTESGTC